MDVSERRKIQNRDAQRRFRSKKSAESATQKRGSDANSGGDYGRTRARVSTARLRGPMLRPREDSSSHHFAEGVRGTSLNQADLVVVPQQRSVAAQGFGSVAQPSPPHRNQAGSLSSASSSSNALSRGIGSSATTNPTRGTSETESEGPPNNAFDAIGNVFDLRTLQTSDASTYATGITYLNPPNLTDGAPEKLRLMQDTDSRTAGLWPIEMFPNDLDVNGEWFAGVGNLDHSKALRGDDFTTIGPDLQPDQTMHGGDNDGDDDDDGEHDNGEAGAKDFQQSALHIAAEHGHASLVTLLLSCAAGPNHMHVDERDSEDNTPLHCACFNGHAGVALRLLQHRADPNARNTSGWTPGHFAVLNGSPEIVKVLTRFGADLSIRAHGRQYCRSGKVYEPL